MDPWTFTIATLAVYRAVRLAVTDSIFAGPRNRLHQWLEPVVEITDGELVLTDRRLQGLRSWVAQLISCQWCLGVWAAFGAVAVWFVVTDQPVGTVSVLAAVATALAMAAGQSLVATVERSLSA
ncbi:MAG: DUF1360 domain-containing protein [Rhodocyclaceae bacterium]|nr:MAG: DUF1360 domain-containing protein [Rhodocyclaceae bacterium]